MRGHRESHAQLLTTLITLITLITRTILITLTTLTTRIQLVEWAGAEWIRPPPPRPAETPLPPPLNASAPSVLAPEASSTFPLVGAVVAVLAVGMAYPYGSYESRPQYRRYEDYYDPVHDSRDEPLPARSDRAMLYAPDDVMNTSYE